MKTRKGGLGKNLGQSERLRLVWDPCLFYHHRVPKGIDQANHLPQQAEVLRLVNGVRVLANSILMEIRGRIAMFCFSVSLRDRLFLGIASQCTRLFMTFQSIKMYFIPKSLHMFSFTILFAKNVQFLINIAFKTLELYILD